MQVTNDLIEKIKIDARMDASNAKFDFYDYCASVPGVTGAKVLAAIAAKGRINTSSAFFWKMAKREAERMYKDWIAQ